MKKKIKYVVLTAFLAISFTKEQSIKFSGNQKVRFNLPESDAIHTVHKGIDSMAMRFTPVVDKRYVGFKEAIAFKESQGNYQKVNTFGYLGKYQFGASTLHRIRIYDTQRFLEDPELQEQAFLALCSLNKWILQRDIKNCVGKRINGIKVTESGILAAAQLAGAGNVKKYLRSNGELKVYDAFGTDIDQYMKRFAGYDISFVQPVKNAYVYQS